MDTRPYYRRNIPPPLRHDAQSFASDRIDLSHCHLPPFPRSDASGALPDSRPLANSLFDSRAAAVVRAAVGNPDAVKDPSALLERKDYGDDAPTIFIMAENCLAAMAFKDYFPKAPEGDLLRQLVSKAIMAAQPGWCGTYGPGIDDGKPVPPGGDYDMRQMFLLPLAYAYYDAFANLAHGPEAREWLITGLLAHGRIHRDNEDDTFTSGPAPADWYRAGNAGVEFIEEDDVPETENHVLMIATARYLTNQLLYPRFPGQTVEVGLGHWIPAYDNRRNGYEYELIGRIPISAPSCMDQVLYLLRNKLRDDFAEYNAKPYQEETRSALLNLFSYAYDAEVRLAAGMVLDYISAHIAVSSCDLRRMVPFRRRNEGDNVLQDPDDAGFMDVSLLDQHSKPQFGEFQGADPMVPHFALHAGNTRAYRLPDNRIWPDESGPVRPWPWAIRPATNFVLEAVCDHRIAPSVHDLFVNDLHRRFFQRLHRTPMPDEPGGQRNCDNMEIYAGSPSFLISAGGRPAIWTIPGKSVGGLNIGYDDSSLGVAVPISFIPTGAPPDPGLSSSDSRGLIQILRFSATPEFEIDVALGETENYGVAPDFACGVGIHLPTWTKDRVPASGDGLFFVPERVRILPLPTLRTAFEMAGLSAQEGLRSLAKQYGSGASFSTRALIDAVNESGAGHPAGFYLAIHRWGDFVVLEAFDTWRHPEVSFEDFQARVRSNSPTAAPVNGQEAVYTTFFGNRIHYIIWKDLSVDGHLRGSKILSIEYGDGNPMDTLVDAGNDTEPFLSGSILKSPRDGTVEIHNPSLGTTLTLDWSDPQLLIRIAENGDTQQAGAVGDEVWVDFNWIGPMEGDFYRPFSTLEDALNAVNDRGVIRIMTGSRNERLTIHKRVRLTSVGGPVLLRSH